jgi:hypothetical protein
LILFKRINQKTILGFYLHEFSFNIPFVLATLHLANNKNSFVFTLGSSKEKGIQLDNFDYSYSDSCIYKDMWSDVEIHSIQTE